MQSNVTSKIVVGFTLRGPPCRFTKLIIRLLGSWKNGNKLSGNNIVCFKYEYVVSVFINEMQAMMAHF